MAKKAMGRQLPVGTRQSVPELEEFDELSDDEISDILSGHKKMPGEDDAPEPEPEPDDGIDEPESAADESEESTDSGEAEEEDTADESAESDAEEEVEEKADGDDEPSPPEKRIALLERRLELEALQRERETEARKRAEILASRQAGRAGYLQQQLKAKAKAPATEGESEPDASDDPWSEDESQSAAVERREQPATSQGLEEIDDTRTELVAMAINDEGTRFANEHAAQLEEMPGEFVERLQELMKEEAAPYVNEFRTGSLQAVRKLARSCMNSAFAAARIEFAQKVEQEATTRKAESVEKSRRRKKKAAISATGRRSAPPKQTKKSYEDMDLDELEAEMEREFGDNYRIGPQRGL